MSNDPSGQDSQYRSYPHGVPCWVDLAQADPWAAAQFYGGLFGWVTVDVARAAGPGTYLIATLDGREVAGIRQAPGREDGASAPDGAGWMTHVAVSSAGQAAETAAEAGGTVISGPAAPGPDGPDVVCADLGGAVFGLRPLGQRPEAQLVNVPGTWNFSHLHTGDPDPASAFYAKVFGWEFDDGPGGGFIRRPGYGQHLAATVDPGIYEWQASAPPGFADVIGGMQPAAQGEATHWHVTFSVLDRDASAAAAEKLGATVLSGAESPWARTAEIRDPQGARFTVSQFTPPD
jgi:predicted enzyme related to lactoylglutathione lyase